MKVALLTLLACILAYVICFVVYDYFYQAEGDPESRAETVPQATEQSNGSYIDFPSIQADSDYGKDFKTYTSDSGFSFKYPPHLKVMELMPQLALVPVSERSNSGSIIISVGVNDENMTAEEWLLSTNSGYVQSKERYGNYHKTTIDGQDAVYTDGGMWAVVNTPNNELRLSIAPLVDGEQGIPFTETGIILGSLVFDR